MKNVSKFMFLNLILCILLIVNLSGCIGSIEPEKVNLELGDAHLGGIIYYFFEPGDPGYIINEQHGLIAAVRNAGEGNFGCRNVIIGTKTELGSGKANSEKIRSSICPEPNIAAVISLDFKSNGFEDWFLPSMEELKRLYANKEHVGSFESFTKEDGKETYLYWTSSENLNFDSHPSTNPNLKPAFAINFENGEIVGSVVKAAGSINIFSIRPIKYF